VNVTTQADILGSYGSINQRFGGTYCLHLQATETLVHTSSITPEGKRPLARPRRRW